MAPVPDALLSGVRLGSFLWTIHWLGVGLGGYAAHSMAMETMHSGGLAGANVLFTHCHNFLLQLLAETGIVGTLGIVTALLWAFLPWLKRKNAGC